MGTSNPVLLAGSWTAGTGTELFEVESARTKEVLGQYPVSPWADVDAMLDAGSVAYEELQRAGVDAVAAFLERLADRIDARGEEICTLASAETALPVAPRLREVELPRTTGQLRQAAGAARSRTWSLPTLSPASRIASMLRPIPGVVAVFGPNNFPLAFNSVAGGDAAAALATGHPVIAKANPLHPGTSLLLAEEALAAAGETPGISAATVQLVYRTDHDTGGRLVSDPRLAASAFTGSRQAGLALKASADAQGKPIYLEMSSINPVVVLPGAVAERGPEVASELAGSATLNGGQFCTRPGLVFALAGTAFADLAASAFARTVSQPLLGKTVHDGLEQGVAEMRERGVVTLAERLPEDETGWCFPNTLLATTGESFLRQAGPLQTELFGPACLLVTCADEAELLACLAELEGNLTGTIYSARDGSDDESYARVEHELAPRVGRLLNDKVPTGVAVVAGMNHGGPFPATGHPGFTAIGLPGSMRRFGMLQSFDNVRDHRLPAELQASNPLGIQRFIEDHWTDEPVTWGAVGPLRLTKP